jgi:hypothetical protein
VSDVPVPASLPLMLGGLGGRGATQVKACRPGRELSVTSEKLRCEMMGVLSYKLGKAFDTNGMSVNYGG